MKPGLPPPVTYEMQYLAAILDELRAIHALLAVDGPPEVSAFIAEPEPKPRRKRATKDGEV